jgi:hypothetical protein
MVKILKSIFAKAETMIAESTGTEIHYHYSWVNAKQ